MGYERHSNELASAKPQISPKAESLSPLAKADAPKQRPATADEPLDIQREARRMRQEWREQRYSRLRAS